MEFVIVVTLFLKLWGVTITTAPVKKHVPLEQTPILGGSEEATAG